MSLVGPQRASLLAVKKSFQSVNSLTFLLQTLVFGASDCIVQKHVNNVVEK